MAATTTASGRAVRSSALAAGAARAGGERAKRRSTPLLGASLAAEAALPKAAKAIPAKVADSAKPATKGSPAKVAKSAKPATKATPAKAAKSAKPATKATPAKAAKATPTKAVTSSASVTAKAVSTKVSPAPSTASAPKHRPRPVVSSTPAERVKRLSGERRVPRQSPRAKRDADQAASARLRLAPTPVPAARRRREEAGSAGGAPVMDTRTAATSAPRPPFDPTIVSGDTSLPMPGVEDLISGAITAIRLAASTAGVSPEDVERRLAQLLAYVRRRLEGDYAVDEFGFDPDFTETIVFPLLRPLYEKWFRIEVKGIENIPDEGGALLVANHSGTIAIDSIMLQLAVHDEHPGHRVMRALGADLVFQSPFLGTFARRTGSTLAANSDAERLFAKGELVGVFPEGFKGVGKPFRERYKLQRFGRGGFVSAALKAKVPIIPVSIVGAEEIAPILGNMSTVARIFGLPYAPITPTFPWLGPLGLIPLPSKWIIEIGAPISTDTFGDRAEDDPMLVFDLTDQVRETIQQTLYSLLMQRRSVFF